MTWSSILPEHLSTVETWVARIFLVLGLITIGPWLGLIVYDFFYYLWRAATYEVPGVGGRARGRQRPRAPSLKERPSGRKRSFSMGIPVSASGTDEEQSEPETRQRPAVLRERSGENIAIEELQGAQ